MSEWLGAEISESNLKDKRLTKRFRNLLEQLWGGIGNTIPFACQDWANTKAAYRFLSNDGVTEDLLLAGHFKSTRKRVDALPGEMILVLQDTTEFSFHRQDTEAVGFTGIIPCNKDILGKPRQRKQCGILMHSSLAIIVFTVEEIRLLDQLIKTKQEEKTESLAPYLIKIARLGGYLARKSPSWIYRYLARVFKTYRYPSRISVGKKYLWVIGSQ